MPSQPSQQVLQETDSNYIGLNSRLDPSNLQPGFAQEAHNVRMQRGTAQPRKGCKRLTESTMNSEYMVGSGTYVDLNGKDNIVLVYRDGIQLYNTENKTVGAKILFPSLVIGGTTYYRDIDQYGVVDVVQALDKLYIFRGEETENRYGTGGTSVTAALDLVYPSANIGQTITITATWINSYASSHPTYVIGDEITIFNVTDSQHSFMNESYIVTSVNQNNFTFSLVSKINANASQHVYGCVVKVKPPLIWDGLSSIYAAPQTSIIDNGQGGTSLANGSVPPSDFGFYFQNRLVCKVAYDRLVVSDIFSDLFDFQINNFKINQGGNDAIVGVLPWIENQFLVFMKRSIWIAYVETTAYGGTGDTSPGANSSVTVVTTQVGCLSRRSIVAAGQFVFFLSGKGVHVLTPQLDLKLLGNTMPLSEPIDDFFDNVNFASASNSVASYYDNRFFIALPTKDSTGNYVSRPNAILIYNTLNQNWESVDTYPSGLYIDGYAICQYGNQRRQFILTNFWGPTNFGGIFLTEEFPNASVSAYGDQFNTSTGTPVLPFALPATLSSNAPYLFLVDARIRSRQYTFDNTNGKRFSRGEYQFNNSPGDVIWITARTHDPDTKEDVLKYVFTGSSTADSTIRPRIALRGACIDMEVQFKSGRPSLKSATIYAIVANRNMVSEE
jgi:hypothetical protein